MSVKGVGTSLNTQTVSNQGRTTSVENELSDPDSVNIQIKSNTFGGVSFPSGSTLKVDYVNGKKEGAGLVLSAKKTKLAKLNFHEDKVDGICVFFNSNGMREKECLYENDIQNGWGCEYKNDKIVFEGLYKNGQRYSELKKYSVDSRFMEEVKNGKTLSVCQYNSNHKREGLCYLYENGVMKSEVKFDNGIEKKKMKEFHNKDMSEFDEKERVIYKGEYNGSISAGFKRTGRGESMKYVKGVLNEVTQLMNGLERVRCVLKGTEMKEYEGDKLVYEGEFCMKNGSVVRNGIGMIHISSSSFYTAVFENGVEKRKMKEMNGDMMIDYDKEGRVVYKGGYDKKQKRKGKGVLFEYNGDEVKEVYDSENGERSVKRIEFEFISMIELNENGGVVYKGSYKGTPRDGYMRNGKGDEFDKDDMLVYSGSWKNGKREGNGSYYQNGDLRYNGEWKNDKPNGDGKIYNSDGIVMREGKWKNGYIEVEKGVWMDYEDGKLCGLYENGERRFEGEWKNDKPHGKGRYLSKEGEVLYEGEWKNGMIEVGKGGWFDYESGMKCLKKGENVVYRGEIMNGVPNGDGSVVNGKEVMIKGDWENGVLKLSKECFVEMKDYVFYLNLHEPSGLFKCGYRWNRYPVSEMNKSVNDFVTDKQNQEVKGAKWMWSELILGILYHMMGILIGREVGMLTTPFMVTGCVFFIIVLVQQCGRDSITVSVVLSFLSLGFIALWSDVYNGEYTEYYQYLDRWGDWNRDWHDMSIKLYLSNHGVRKFVYILFGVLMIYLPIASLLVLASYKRSKSTVHKNAFSIMEQTKSYECIVFEMILGFVFMFVSSLACANEFSYKPSYLEERGFVFPNSWGILIFVNGVVYLIIASLQCHSKTRIVGGVCGILWGIASLVGFIIFACNMNGEEDSIFGFFIIVCTVTWIDVPLSSVILYENKNNPSM